MMDPSLDARSAPAPPLCDVCQVSIHAQNMSPPWEQRHFFGARPFHPSKNVCVHCFQERLWKTWRFFVLLICLLGACIGAAEGHFLAPVVLLPVSLFWIAISTHQLKHISRARAKSESLSEFHG